MLETVKTCLNCGGEILKPRATMYYRANLLKSDAKVWELEAVLEDLKGC